MAFTFNVKEKAQAEAWVAQAEALNERAAQACKEAGEILQEFQTMAEGKVFDKVVEYSDAVISGVATILQGMNQVLETVNKVLADIINKIQELFEDAENTRAKAFS